MRIYGVICYYRDWNKNLKQDIVEVVSDNEDRAKKLALQIVKKVYFCDPVVIGCEVPGNPSGVWDYGPAAQSDIDAWKSHCKKYNINTNIN